MKSFRFGEAKRTLLLLTGCLALTAATAQRPNPDDRFDTDLSEQELRSLSIPDPFDGSGLA